MNTCAIPICDRPTRNLGYCNAHYQRFKNGNLDPERPIRPRHGMTNAPEYYIWEAIISRCTRQSDKAYGNYGGRGIEVCDEWRHDFSAFLRHVGLRPSNAHSIERRDYNGNYEPGNVYWTTRGVQNHNKRPRSKVGVRGILERKGRYGAQIRCNNTYFWLGTYNTLEEAVNAYIKKEAELYPVTKPYLTPTNKGTK